LENWNFEFVWDLGFGYSNFHPALCLLPNQPPTNNNFFLEEKLFGKWSLKPK
jgi:hypothetical protein